MLARADLTRQVCLFGPPVLELRPLLRDSSISDDQILSHVATAVRGKKFAHNGSSSARLCSCLAVR